MPSANVALSLSARTRTTRFLFLSALLAFVCGLTTLCCTASAVAAEKSNDPNIIYILADDMGYGDIKALNPECKIATPHLDQLARGGMVFTDAHTSSSVCTPTRYGVLTGRYNWRSRLKSGVLWGLSRRLIEQDRMTVPSMLKQHGYYTAAVGKWHLGMDWTLKDGGIATEKSYNKKTNPGWDVDYSKPIQNGPNSVGFDYFYGISASLDMPPYVYIENNKSQGIPTVTKAFFRDGPAHKDFEAIDVLPRITEKTVQIIDEHAAASKKGKPFFIYFPLNAPHTPILPTPEWQGKSGINAYCDFVMQVDDTVGQVMQALKKQGIHENTLVIFTADNGCSPAANFKEMADKDHQPSYRFRGHKADIYEGGHRVPFIANWPARVKAGTHSDQLICLTDLMATAADIVGAKLPDNAGEDSVSILPALEGKDTQPVREAAVHHSIRGAFSIRKDHWKLEFCPGSGGWSFPKPGKDDLSQLPPIQLYDLNADLNEQKNLQSEYPEVVKELTDLLQSYVDRGRSTPGAPQENNGDVDIFEAGKSAHKMKRPQKKKPAKAKS
ncbi:sulfatase family protein [Gimesia chilikensis]|uniref:Arylsulfatase n=1 Tax=Gimesia chilikensis TaxID=2605989 RepID=A0A517PGD8_9PLAN|nr:arylsulfatase [Gimesia chilikensis]QDT18431.1 Arylsulfatase [Gimesia chilikensis]